MIQNPLLIVLGPTASGKTRLATSLAADLNAEIISADSRQVYRGMDIGTGKDLAEYMVDGRPIPYHLIDIIDAGDRYQVNLFKEDFYRIFASLTSEKKIPILCGGTGMYIHSLLQNHQYTAVPVNQRLRESLSGKSLADLQHLLESYPLSTRVHADQSTVKRLIRAIEIADYLSEHTLEVAPAPPFSPLVIGLTTALDVRRERIRRRLDERMEMGLIDEVRSLLNKGISKEMLEYYGLEYKFVAAYLNEELDYDQLMSRLYIAICQYAKRQMTFFRKMEKDGVHIHWLDATSPSLFSEAKELVHSKWFV